MEILKEAYWKLGRQKEALAITRKLADTYYALGQFSSALLEYEGIIQKEPNNADVLAMLGEVESKLNQTSHSRQQNGEAGADQSGDGEKLDSISLDFGAVIGEDPTLITTSATVKPDGSRLHYKFEGDGNEPLAKFLIQHKLAPENVVKDCLDRVNKLNKNAGSHAISASLIDEISRSNMVNLDTLLCGILDRSKFAFIPLDYYEVDRQIVKMLPETMTMGRLILPFDVVSRTVMVAMANPFDAQGKEAVQQLLDYNIQWHVAAPAAITKVLADAYRLDAQK